jgi:hypothetical protein
LCIIPFANFYFYIIFSSICFRLFDKDWNIKVEDFKKANKDKGLSEQDLSSMGAKGTTMYMYNDKLDQIPVKVSYAFTKDGLAMKGIVGGSTDAKVTVKLLKLLKDQTIKKFGTVFDEKEMNGMKMLSWKNSKNYGVMLMQMPNGINLQVMNKSKMKDGK